MKIAMIATADSQTDVRALPPEISMKEIENA